MSDHYTAVLTITKTEAPEKTTATTFDRRVIREDVTKPREVVEIAKVVVRAPSLDALRDKVAAHAALLGE